MSFRTQKKKKMKSPTLSSLRDSTPATLLIHILLPFVCRMQMHIFIKVKWDNPECIYSIRCNHNALYGHTWEILWVQF